jgi:hypothetical protein
LRKLTTKEVYLPKDNFTLKGPLTGGGSGTITGKPGEGVIITQKDPDLPATMEFIQGEAVEKEKKRAKKDAEKSSKKDESDASAGDSGEASKKE